MFLTAIADPGRLRRGDTDEPPSAHGLSVFSEPTIAARIAS